MKNQLITPFKLTVLVFFISLAIGFGLAVRKPVWNDEIFTQVSTVEKPSYLGIFLIQFEEGNGCPLFYLLQKAVCDLTGYRFPKGWSGDDWTVQDLRSQIILRINPNIFTSLTIALIFYFFTCYYSLAAGGYALLVTLSSFMIWAYWVEARPYSIWTLLTTMQCLLFLALIKEKNDDRRLWRWLLATHLFLAFTVVISAVQVLIVSVLLWLFKDRNWKRYTGLTLVPVAISISYYLLSPKYNFFFSNTILELIGAGIPRDRMLIIALYAAFLGGYWFYEKRKSGRGANDMTQEGAAFLLLTVLMILSAAAVLLKMKMSLNTERPGFQISNRYFTYLTPVGIIAVSLFSVHLFRAVPYRWMKCAVVVMFLGLFIFRVMRTYGQLQGMY